MTTSCSDDDNDLPNVDLSLTVSNCAQVDGVIYVVQGQTLQIDAINIKNNEEGKGAAITHATYYWDYQPLGIAVAPPFAFNIVTTKPEGDVPGTALGKHLLQIEMQIVAVDKEVAVGAMVYQVNVVESEDDIPDGVQPGTFTFDAKPTVKDKD